MSIELLVLRLVIRDDSMFSFVAYTWASSQNIAVQIVRTVDPACAFVPT
jgi:hypothetical protein